MSDMRTIIEKMESAMKPRGMVERQEPNPGGESDVVTESVSAGAIDRLVDAMFYNPKVEAMIERFGLDSRGKANFLTDLRLQITPVIKIALSKTGQRVAGASQAKAAVRAMTKG